MQKMLAVFVAQFAVVTGADSFVAIQTFSADGCNEKDRKSNSVMDAASVLQPCNAAPGGQVSSKMVCKDGFVVSEAYTGTECAGDPIKERTVALKCFKEEDASVWNSMVCNPDIEGYTKIPIEKYSEDDCTDNPVNGVVALKLDSCEKGGDFNDGKWTDEYSMATRVGNDLIHKVFTSSKCDGEPKKTDTQTCGACKEKTKVMCEETNGAVQSYGILPVFILVAVGAKQA